MIKLKLDTVETCSPWDVTYRVRPVVVSGKVYHAVEAGECGAVAAILVLVEFGLFQSIPAGLSNQQVVVWTTDDGR